MIAIYCTKCGEQGVETLPGSNTGRCPACGHEAHIDTFPYATVTEQDQNDGEALARMVAERFGRTVMECAVPFGKALLDTGLMRTPINPQELQGYLKAIARGVLREVLEHASVNAKAEITGRPGGASAN